MGARSAASHTNALAGEYATWKAGLRQAGVISVDSVDEFLAVLTGLQGFVPRPGGRGVALVGNGGGATVLATDLLAERGMTLAAIGETTKAAIAALQLPPGSTVGNPTDTPVNALDKGGSQALGSVVNTLLRDPAVHELILHLNLIPLVNYENRQSIADGISQALSMLDGQGKPIYVAVRSAPEDVLETLRVQLLESARNKQLPCFHSAHEAIDAMSRIYEWCRRPRPATAPTRAPVSPSAAKRARARIAHLPKGTRLVPQDVAFELLDIFGIPHPRSILARSREEAVRAAAECGYPVALKVDSPDIVHKTEADGVRVGLRSEKEVAGAFDAIGQASRAFMPDAEIRGVLVQAMEGEPLAEVICGLKTDPVFGPVVLLGMGGTLVEILKDASLRVLPLGQEDPGLMWRDLGGARLLTGYRGKPPADTDAIEDLLERVSVMGEMIPEIAEMDLNPVMVKEKGAGLNVVDCRMIVTG